MQLSLMIELVKLCVIKGSLTSKSNNDHVMIQTCKLAQVYLYITFIRLSWQHIVSGYENILQETSAWLPKVFSIIYI